MKYFVDLLERIKRENLQATIIAKGIEEYCPERNYATYRINWGDLHYYIIKEVYDDCVVLEEVDRGVKEGGDIAVSISAITQIFFE